MDWKALRMMDMESDDIYTLEELIDALERIVEEDDINSPTYFYCVGLTSLQKDEYIKPHSSEES